MMCSEIDNYLLLGKWITGGMPVSIKSIRRLQSLTPYFTYMDLRDIIQQAGLEIPRMQALLGESKTKSSNRIIKTPNENETPKGNFTLPGARYLEKFFFENVIDIVLNPEKYEPLGITFPSPIILHGEPGTGKTYSVEKLAEYLDFPVFTIDSQSIASQYIHHTAQKISEVFIKAFDSSPAIVIIDEMEAYLSKRDHAHDHKLKETAEFLRLLPEAPKNNVLVVGMTNLYENIDPAILRSGRFDHKIEVLMPTYEDIKAMLDNALEKLPIEPDIDFDVIIKKLVNKPRSDTAFVIKEAARLTAFKSKTKISQIELMEAMEEIVEAGSMSSKERRIGF